MNTAIGYVLVLGSVLVIRQVVVGRVSETPADMRDLFLALINGDTSSAANVLSQRGSNVDDPGNLTGTKATGPGSLAGGLASISGSSTVANNLVSTMKTLGSNAKGYSQSPTLRTGPDYYDCSGLVWRALHIMGVYKGPSFWTGSFESIATKFATEVDLKTDYPKVGDIAIWPYKHMGVIDAADSLYSARSSSKGIGSVSLSGDIKYFGTAPHYWRLNA